MPDGANPVEPPDILVAVVQKRIARLADGNPFPAACLRFEGSRTDRVVQLCMRVAVEASRTERTYTGAISPEGSRLCADPAAADAYLKRSCAEAAASGATLKRLQEMLAPDPAGAFTALEDGKRIGVPAGRSHVHCTCNSCSGRGKRPCGNCRQTGDVPCGCGDGRLKCYHGCNNGQFSYSEFYNGHATTKYRVCTGCGGSGRGFTCARCRGRSYVTCDPCDGSGWVGCKHCASTGNLTVSTVAELVTRPARTIMGAADLPKEFVAALQSIPFRELPRKHGTVERHAVQPENGLAAVQLQCRLADIRVTAEVTGVEPHETGFSRKRFDIVAIGKSACIPSMPPFLDDLAYTLVMRIEVAASGRQAAHAIDLAKKSRLTASVLKSVADRNGEDDVAIVRRWEQAVTEQCVLQLRAVLNKAYDDVGAGAIRRSWLWLGLPALYAAAAAYPFRFGSLALDALPAFPVVAGLHPTSAEILASGTLGIMPVLAVAGLARWAATRAARIAVGADARRAPRQGWWLRAPVLLAVALLATGLSRNMPARTLQTFPPVSATHQVWSGGTPIQVPQPARTASSLSPSPLPALQAEWPPRSYRGDPQVYMAQFCLAQMGLLQQAPNGLTNTVTRNAIERLLTFLPRSRRRPANNAEAALLASAALRGEFRLERTPADLFLTAGMSNLTRANLTGLDVEAIKASAFRALREPGVEISWTGRNGLLGGRILAALPADGCADLDIEVRVRGAVERTGPVRACWSHGSLVRMNSR